MPDKLILSNLKTTKSKLTKSEQKVAEFVLIKAPEVIHMRIVDVATEASVSEPTIVRFCRSIGFDSFQSFKLNLAQQLARERTKVPFPVTQEDDITGMGNKVLDGTLITIDRLKHTLDWSRVDQGIQLIDQAKRLYFFGFGASGSVAQDAQQKFFRLKPETYACSDPDMQIMTAGLLSTTDCLVAISQSGRNTNLIKTIECARLNHCPVISISPFNTPISDLASLPMKLNIDEDTDVFTPMISRLIHLIVLDIIATGLYLKHQEQFDRQLERLKGNLTRLRKKS